MCNMSSAISTRPDSRRGFPWRALGVLLCLLAAGIYAGMLAQQTRARLADERHDRRLETAGPLAEGFEEALAETDDADPRAAMAALITGTFTADPELAAARVWTRELTLTCEVTRDEPSVARAGEGGMLPPLGIATPVNAINARLQNAEWVDAIARIRQLELEQDTLTEQLATQGGVAFTPKVRRQFVDRLQAEKDLAGVANEGGILDDAVADMGTVVEAVRGSDDVKAASMVETVSADLTAALTDFRASADALPDVPAQLRASAPKPEGWWVRFRPEVRAERVVVPLFTLTTDDRLAVPAGFAEVIFYHYPGEVLGAMSSLGPAKKAPAAALLVLALIFLLWPRRKPQPAPALKTPGVKP